MKRLLCLTHDKDQTGQILGDILFKAIESEPYAWQARTKEVVQFVIARAVEEISYSIQKYNALKKKNGNRHPILFEDQVGKQNDQ